MRHTTNDPSQRMLRVGEQIKHVIAEVFLRGDFYEEDLLETPNVTVTEVRVSPDLKHATAYVISLGGAEMGRIIPALNREAAHFQKEINRQTQLKFTPKLQFRLDETYDKASRLEGIINTLKYSDQE